MSRVGPFEVSLEDSGDLLLQTSDDDVLVSPLQLRTVLALTPATLAKAVALIDDGGQP